MKSYRDLVEGDRIIYNDGRPGHQGVSALVLAVDSTGLLVQFEDRADSTYIRFADRQWMDFISVTGPMEEVSDMKFPNGYGQGTYWTAPGEGATYGELHDAACGPDRWNEATSDAQHATLRFIADKTRSHWFGMHTNLGLTGKPLNAYDLKRIEQAR